VRVEIGVKLPNSGPFATREGIRATALACERLGYDMVWVHDHVHRTLEHAQAHPAAGSLKAWDTWEEPPTPNMFEAMTTLSFVAGLTERIKLGPSVIVLPLRNPVWLAKYAATLDQLSGGRFVMGVGSGGGPYIGTELNAVGMGNLLEGRGRVVDEWIEIMRRVWEQPVTAYEGEFLQIGEGVIYPKPVQDPLPIWYGGSGRRARERTARSLNGWFGVGWAAPASVAKDIDSFRELVASYSRDPSEIAIAGENWLAVDEDHEAAVDRAADVHRKLTDYVTSFGTTDTKALLEKDTQLAAGSPDHLVELMTAYSEAGLDHIILRPLADDLNQLLDQLAMFKERVIDRLPATARSAG
jgi:probable F420-dependent oxidoreductase